MLIGNVAAFALLVAAFAVSGAPVPRFRRSTAASSTSTRTSATRTSPRRERAWSSRASGEILTNNHVIRGATTIHVTVPATNRSYSATVVGYDVAADVAVLKLQGASGLQTVALGNSDTLTRGQT